jgi:hypothetical protein
MQGLSPPPENVFGQRTEWFTYPPRRTARFFSSRQRPERLAVASLLELLDRRLGVVSR